MKISSHTTLVLVILVLLIVNALQTDMTSSSLKFSKEIGRDNTYLVWENSQYRDMISYYNENGEMPEFTPLD